MVVPSEKLRILLLVTSQASKTDNDITVETLKKFFYGKFPPDSGPPTHCSSPTHRFSSNHFLCPRQHLSPMRHLCGSVMCWYSLLAGRRRRHIQPKNGRKTMKGVPESDDQMARSARRRVTRMDASLDKTVSISRSVRESLGSESSNHSVESFDKH